MQSLRDYVSAAQQRLRGSLKLSSPKSPGKGAKSAKSSKPAKGAKSQAKGSKPSAKRWESLREAAAFQAHKVRKQAGEDLKWLSTAVKNPRQTAADLWNEHRVEVLGGAVVLSLGVVALVGYQLLKRPGDVLNPDVPFVSGSTELITETVNWPTYGYDDERTRYLAAEDLEPPFRKLWTYDAEELLEYSPIVVDGVIYGIDNKAEAFAIDAKHGQVLWERRIGELNASAPTYHDGKLFFVNLEPGQALALDAKTGKTDWQRDLPDRSESTPVVHDDKVIFGAQNGDLFALNAKNGKEEWSTDLGGEVKAAPALQEGIVYVGTYGGEMIAVRANNGDIKWKSSSQGQSFGRAGRFYASPAVAFGRVYAGNVDGKMYSFDKENGELAWSKSTGGYVYAAPVAADTPKTPPTIYFGSFDGTFYALDAKDGSERWTEELKGAVSGAASVVGGIAYVANVGSTETQGFNIENGKLVFQINSGAYNPVISDGKRIFLTGWSKLAGFAPELPERTRKEKLKDKAAGQGKDGKKGGGGKGDGKKKD